jgi:hypothetical protein
VLVRNISINPPAPKASEGRPPYFEAPSIRATNKE